MFGYNDEPVGKDDKYGLPIYNIVEEKRQPPQRTPGDLEVFDVVDLSKPHKPTLLGTLTGKDKEIMAIQNKQAQEEADRRIKMQKADQLNRNNENYTATNGTADLPKRDKTGKIIEIRGQTEADFKLREGGADEWKRLVEEEERREEEPGTLKYKLFGYSG